jgi:hypothetical protein
MISSSGAVASITDRIARRSNPALLNVGMITLIGSMAWIPLVLQVPS